MSYSFLKLSLVLGFCLMLFRSVGQNALAKGGAVPDLPIKKMLNSSSPVTSFSRWSHKLTVVDFLSQKGNDYSIMSK